MDNNKQINPVENGVKNINKKIDTSFWQPSLLMFSRMSGWVVGPVVLAIFLGKWLDKRHDTEPWLFLGTVGLAFVISIVGLVKDALREMEKLSKEDKNK
ncbi:MAG: AtpZ/AtpI family protein [Candidatus Falkowbacteria bacterium]